MKLSLPRRYVYCLAALFLLVCGGCTSDCIYKNADDVNGDELCYRFCPKKDDEGNDVTVIDDNGDEEPVLEKRDVVDPINCEGIDLTSTSSSTTDTTATSTN